MRTLVPLRLLAAALIHLAAGQALARETAGPAPGAGDATLTLAARSIGSRRGHPPEKRAHAALLVRFAGRAGGFIVQGGKETVPGFFRDGARVTGYVIPAADPSSEFTRAAGAFWGEPGVRELPTRELATFTVPGLTEERLRAAVAALNEELRPRDYRLEAGPSSNSFVSRLLDHLGMTLPPLGETELPGWGWRP